MKIGIVTHYHKSKNCGGILQAYALCKVIEGLGDYEAEQIKIEILGNPLTKNFRKISEKDAFMLSVKRWIYRILYAKKIRSNSKIKKEFVSVYDAWRDKYIRHSKEEYLEKNIEKCAQYYDCFITGSDQVWNTDFYFSPLFLKFVPGERGKLSYAASMCQPALDEYQKDVIKEHLKDYSAISVREEEMVDIIGELTPLNVEVTLDPVLLLDSEKWDEISSPKLIEEGYLFCYFLGSDISHRKLAKEYAEKRGLKVAIIYPLDGKIRKADEDFGDIRIKNGTPSDFISLIKNAEVVLTDSFHATAFSGIYGKEVFVFKRSESRTMSSRIYTLSCYFGLEEHFLDSEEKLSCAYIESCKKIKYAEKNEKLDAMKERSVEFLKRNLKNCKGE